MATKYPNSTDKQIADRENAAFDGQIPVLETQPTKFIIGGQSSQVQSGKTVVGNAGVVKNWDDGVKFVNPGKA
jgi:hypothetical protein